MSACFGKSRTQFGAGCWATDLQGGEAVAVVDASLGATDVDAVDEASAGERIDGAASMRSSRVPVLVSSQVSAATFVMSTRMLPERAPLTKAKNKKQGTRAGADCCTLANNTACAHSAKPFKIVDQRKAFGGGK
jgi:hypothetical protein